MNKRIAAMRDAVGVCTQMLASRRIRVTQAGIKAFVEYDKKGNPTRVNVPYMPDNASESLMDAVQGFMDHEVGHLLFSDAKVVIRGFAEKNPGLHNLIEDTFVERQMMREFRGSKDNIEKVNTFVLDKMIGPAYERIKGDATAVDVFNKALGASMVRAWAGQQIHKDFMADKWDSVKELVDVIGSDVIDAIPKLKNSAECLELANEIKRRLTTVKPPEPKADPKPKPKPKPEDKSEKPDEEEQDDPDKGEPSNSDGDESEEPGDSEASGGSSDEVPDEESESDAPGESEESEEPGSKDASDESEGEGDTEDEEESESSPTSTSPGEDEKEDEGESSGGDDESEDEADEEGSSGGNRDVTSKNDSADESEEKEVPEEGTGQSGEVLDMNAETSLPPTEFDETPKPLATPEELEKSVKGIEDHLAEHVGSEVVDALRDSDYMVFSTDEDRIEVPPTEYVEGVDSESVRRMTDRMDSMVGYMQKDLERAMIAKSRVRWNPGQRSGRLSSASLFRLKTGDMRVFRTKEDNKSRDVVASIVVDCSGSMSGHKIQTAMMSAYAICSVLERIKIKHEVIGFTTDNMSDNLLEELMNTEQKLMDEMGFESNSGYYNSIYARRETLYMPIFKGYDERITPTTRKRMVWGMSGLMLANNVDGECIELAHLRLKRQSASRHIMIVLSDGNPRCSAQGPLDAHLLKVVKQIEDAGTTIVGIGICDDAVERFYKRHLVLDNPEQLPKAVMGQLKDMLLDGYLSGA